MAGGAIAPGARPVASSSSETQLGSPPAPAPAAAPGAPATTEPTAAAAAAVPTTDATASAPQAAPKAPAPAATAVAVPAPGTAAVSPPNAEAVNPSRVSVAVSVITKRLTEGGEHNDVSRNDMITVANYLRPLDAAERCAVVSQLSDACLEKLGNELRGGGPLSARKGLTTAEVGELWKMLAEGGLSDSQAKALSTDLSREDARLLKWARSEYSPSPEAKAASAAVSAKGPPLAVVKADFEKLMMKGDTRGALALFKSLTGEQRTALLNEASARDLSNMAKGINDRGGFLARLWSFFFGDNFKERKQEAFELLAAVDAKALHRFSSFLSPDDQDLFGKAIAAHAASADSKIAFLGEIAREVSGEDTTRRTGMHTYEVTKGNPRAKNAAVVLASLTGEDFARGLAALQGAGAEKAVAVAARGTVEKHSVGGGSHQVRSHSDDATLQHILAAADPATRSRIELAAGQKYRGTSEPPPSAPAAAPGAQPPTGSGPVRVAKNGNAAPSSALSGPEPTDVAATDSSGQQAGAGVAVAATGAAPNGAAAKAGAAVKTGAVAATSPTKTPAKVATPSGTAAKAAPAGNKGVEPASQTYSFRRVQVVEVPAPGSTPPASNVATAAPVASPANFGDAIAPPETPAAPVSTGSVWLDGKTPPEPPKPATTPAPEREKAPPAFASERTEAEKVGDAIAPPETPAAPVSTGSVWLDGKTPPEPPASERTEAEKVLTEKLPEVPSFKLG